MENSPWEPYPERKRKLEERRRRPKNGHKRGGISNRDTNPTGDSSFSTSPSSSDRLPSDCFYIEETGHSSHNGNDGTTRDSHILKRPVDCSCLHLGGCGDEDGCCAEDLKGLLVCPCLQRITNNHSSEVKLDEVGTCNVCLEDGKLRTCCNRHYCKLCYQSTGNCPGCDLITVGANRGLLPSTSAQMAPADGAAMGFDEQVREGEECRLCLRQGFTRKCCGDFFCSDCYFKTGHCPGCQKYTIRGIRYQRIPRDPGIVPVLIGYLATLLVSLAALACVAVVVANNRSFIPTVFGRTCYGFFPSCRGDIKCVEFDGGSTSSGLEPITQWSECDDESTVNKVYGNYCVFDEGVYEHSHKKWGFDFCADEFLASDNGVYVFEDTFELWTTKSEASSNTMASARWDHITNGEISDACGVGAGEASVLFSGADVREAETLDVDISYGGKLVFLFKMGPYVLDPSSVACKPAYGGNVHLYYSLDTGTKWKVLTILDTASYRTSDFTEVEVEVPSSWNAGVIRFKWKQESFHNAFESWALDDVRIVSYFLENWHETKAFAEILEAETRTMREIQCCLNSNQCDLSRNRQEAVDCSVYDSETSNERALLGAELFVVLAALLALARFMYRMAERIVLDGWEYLLPPILQKKRAKIFMADDPVPGTMNKLFELDVDPRWRVRFLWLVVAPLAICFVYCTALVGNLFLVEELTLLPNLAHPFTVKLKVHASFLLLLAMFMDAQVAFVLARDVVCVLPVWVPDVDVDLRPSAGWIRVGQRVIPLADIKDTEMFSRGFCVWLAAGYIVGAMPYCLMALILKYSYISYSAARHLTSLMGCVLFWRAWLGPDWVVKSGYLLQWLFTVDMYRRDDIGNALTAGKTKYLMTYCAISGTLLTMGFMQLFGTRLFAILPGVSVAAFAIYGLGLSVVQGLPVTPNVKLTTISRGTMIRVHRRVLCPCKRHLEQCGEMHSRDELLCMFVRDALTFSEMLRGDDTIE